MKKLFTFFAVFCCFTFAVAQTTQIVTGHPDFKVKVTRASQRCARFWKRKIWMRRWSITMS